MSSLREAALELVRRGETTLEEVDRETPLEE
jgi:type II secretory ATPase GspE/PulE/Tfp pilus assembly ATPase PilB-like protein